ncbi:MAG: MoaD/ThiS family protein [Anaerolineales bacterium]|jgi:molybdopterin converting factor small subunit
MRIRFFANMRTLVGQDCLDLGELEGGNTLDNLLTALVERFPQIYPHLFNSAGNLRQDVPIFINGRNPRLRSEGGAASIPSDAEVSFFSPISSGRMNVEVLRDAPLNVKDQNHEN